MTECRIRPATAEDVPAIVALLADDALGASRESPDDLMPYREAFARISRDPHQHLVVAERGGEVVGTLQVTVVSYMSRRGSTRAVVEGVRIRRSDRGTGLGTVLMHWAIEKARDEGCDLVQLTSDASRTDAHRFYERLGFTASHVGFKRALDGPATTSDLE